MKRGERWDSDLSPQWVVVMLTRKEESRVLVKYITVPITKKFRDYLRNDLYKENNSKTTKNLNKSQRTDEG